MLCSYDNQTGFEGRWADRRACSDFGWLLLLADDRPLSYDWMPVVLIGFVLAIGVFVISLITLFIGLIRLRRSSRAPNVP